MTIELDGVSADAPALPDAAPVATPSAPEPAPQSELTTRDIIRAAVDKQKAGEATTDEPAPRSDGRAARPGRYAWSRRQAFGRWRDSWRCSRRG
jgi:hypothetical protein